jgi:hypothetical protein
MSEKTLSRAEGSERLKERRRRSRRRSGVVAGIFVLVLIAGGIWLTWQPYVRIATVSISNIAPELNVLGEAGDLALIGIAQRQIDGTYVGIIPRDSIFFIPEHDLREALRRVRPGIATVSFSRIGFTSLHVAIQDRVPAGRWCGLQKSVQAVDEYCYFFDAGGFLYAAVDAASSTPPLNPYILYAPLADNATEPFEATLRDAAVLSGLFDFAHEVGTLGSPVESIIIRDDEVDCLLRSGTRITYVRGEEKTSFTNLVSAVEKPRLTDGSIDYIDLRFGGKVYLKKR